MAFLFSATHLTLQRAFRRLEVSVKSNQINSSLPVPGSVECYDLLQRQWREEESYPEDIWEHVCLPVYVPKGRHSDQISFAQLWSTEMGFISLASSIETSTNESKKLNRYDQLKHRYISKIISLKVVQCTSCTELRILLIPYLLPSTLAMLNFYEVGNGGNFDYFEKVLVNNQISLKYTFKCRKWTFSKTCPWPNVQFSKTCLTSKIKKVLSIFVWSVDESFHLENKKAFDDANRLLITYLLTSLERSEPKLQNIHI